MNLQIGICTDDGRTVDKTFSVISTVSGKIKGNADIINPIFEIATPSNLGINYCYCSEWARYYYIDSIEVMQGGKVALHCRVDVLKSFSAGIKALSVIIDKQEYIQNGNMYRDDGSFVTTAKHYNEVKEFNGSSFNSNGKFILICAGGEGTETGGGGGEDNPPVEQKTLSSITATLTGTYDTNNSISDVTSHITVTAHYSDSTTATVTGTFDTSNVVMSTAGTYSIGVSYTEGGVTKTTSVSVVVAQAGGGEEPTRELVYSEDFIEADITSDNTNIGVSTWNNIRDRYYTYEFEYEITNNVGSNNSLRATNAMTSFKLFSANVNRTSMTHTFKAIGSTRTGQPFVCRISTAGNSYHIKIWNLKIYLESEDYTPPVALFAPDEP